MAGMVLYYDWDGVVMSGMVVLWLGDSIFIAGIVLLRLGWSCYVWVLKYKALVPCVIGREPLGCICVLLCLCVMRGNTKATSVSYWRDTTEATFVCDEREATQRLR